MSEEQKLEIEKGLAEIVSEDTVEYETLMKMHRKWEKLFFQKNSCYKTWKVTPTSRNWMVDQSKIKFH